MQLVAREDLKDLPPYCGKVEVVNSKVRVEQVDLPYLHDEWKNNTVPQMTPYESTKLSSEEYSYTFHESNGGVSIVLSQKSSGKQKEFFLAGAKDIWRLRNHMHSLTDDLCSQWFANREHKKNKKKE